MSYLKSMATSFVYIAFLLAVVTFMPGLPPVAEFSEYSIKSPVELVGVLAPNDRLNGPEILLNGKIKGPECFDSYNGELYTAVHDGFIGKIVGKKFIPVAKLGKTCDGAWDENKCGRLLGLKFDKQGRLYIADAYYGISKVDVKTGKYEKLFDASQPIDGKVPMIINSVDVANNGDVYWTDSSTEFELRDGLFTMFANPSGRLLRYNAATKKNEVLLKNLGFANGLKLSDDESHVIVAETLTSVLVKYNLKGPNAGKSQVLIDGLPGIPDNVHSDGQGNYIVALVVSADPQNPQLTQTLIPHPNIRKMFARLFALAELPFKLLNDVYPNNFAKRVVHAIGSFESTKFMYPQKVTVLRIDPNGNILDALHNSDEKIAGISSAFVHDGFLWLGSPFNEYLARVPLKQAFPNTVFPQRAREPTVVPREAPAIAKPIVAEPKLTKTTAPKPTARATTPATPAKVPEPPKPAKIETTKPKEPQVQPEIKQQAPKKVEIPKPIDRPDANRAAKKTETVSKTTTNDLPESTKPNGSKKPANKVEAPVKKTEEQPRRPIKQTGSKESAKKSETAAGTTNELPESMKKDHPKEPTKQAESVKPKQPEASKPPKKNEPVRRHTKIADEI